MKSIFTALGALGTAVALSACSPGLFFGNDKDKFVTDKDGYRQINTACAGMNLSSSTLDAPTTRQLLACFNSQGALEPIQRLIDRLSDDQLESIIGAGNRHLLNNSKLLYQVDRTYHHLEERKMLDETLLQLGRVLENEELIASSIAVLKDGYESDREQLLQALALLSEKMTPSAASSGLDAALTVSESKAFSELLSRFQGESAQSRSLRELTDLLLAYLKERNDPAHADAGRELLKAIGEANLLEALDPVLGADEAQFKSRIPRTASVLKASLAENGKMMSGMTSLFHYLHKAPISCMDGAKVVPDGVMHVLRELSEHADTDAATYFKRTNLLSLVSMNPLCSYPPELGRHYPTMFDLADTNAMEPAAELIKALYRVEKSRGNGTSERPLAQMLIRLLSDTGSGGFGLPAEDTAGIKRMIPVLAEVHDRQAWEALLLLAALPRAQDRADLQEMARFLTQPHEQLKGRSIYDVLSEAISGTSPVKLYDLFFSLRHFTDPNHEVLKPAVTTLRLAYHVNDAHPFVEIGRTFLAEAPRNRKLFDTLFYVSELPEFKESVQLISTMAKDGRLKELLGAMVTLMQRFAQQGEMPVKETNAPAFVPLRRHNLGTADLVPYPLVSTPSENDPCRKIDLNLSMADHHNPAFQDQVTHVLACLNSNGQHADVAAAVEFLRNQKTESGHSLLEGGIDLMKSLHLTGAQMGFLYDSFARAFDDGRLFRLLDAVPFWVTHSFGGPGEGNSGALLRPLLALAKPLLSERPALHRLSEYGGHVLRREDFPSLLKYADGISQVIFDPVETQDPNVYDMNQLMDWVRKRECRASGVRERADQIVYEFKNARTSWEFINGQPRMGWTLPEAKSFLESSLKTMAQVHAGDAKKRVYDSMLAIMRYFTLAPGQKPNRYQHYTPDQLLKWVHERSTDYQPIMYYFPGEKAPRVRLVNTLDRLDLVLVDADFEAPILKTNFGLKFLGELAEAWGDEPYELWPEEIKKKKADGYEIKTLAQVVEDIFDSQETYENMVGFPELPACAQIPPGPGGWMPGLSHIKPHLYNVRQVIDVMKENVANGGLRVLRDLFFEIYYSTPEKYRTPTSGEKNHLSLILKSVRMGVFRQLGRNAMMLSKDDPALQDFFKSLIYGSSSPQMRPVMDALIVNDPNHDTIWKLVDETFKAIDSGADGARLSKQTGFYVLALGGQLWLTEPFLMAAGSVLGKHQGWMTQHGDLFGSFLSNGTISDFLRALYENPDLETKSRLGGLMSEAMSDQQRALDTVAVVRAVVDDAQARKSWNQFVDRWKILEKDPVYQQLQVGDVVKDIIRFFEEDGADPRAAETARTLRLALAERTESGDLEQLLIVAKNNPNEFYRVLETVSNRIENGDLKWLLALARRSVSNP